MKRSKWVWLVFAVIGVFFLSERLLGGDGSATEINLAESSNHADFPAVLQSGFRYWKNAYLIAIDGPPFMVPDRPGVILYDRYGAVGRQATVWPEGAETVSVTDAAVSPSGKLVVSGGASNRNGAITNFIAEIGSGDRINRLVRTTPFVPWYLCALDDGTVWAYGYDRDASRIMVQNAPRLRQYSFEKGQLQAMLDTSTLPDTEASREAWHFAGGRYIGEVSLRCNSKTVVLYNGGTGDLVEYDLQKTVMQLTKVAALPVNRTFHITGFALTDSGEIFASFHDISTPKAPISGLFRLSRDNAGAKWVAVPGTVGLYLKDSPIEKLWGADGDSLVFSRLKDGRLFWTK